MRRYESFYLRVIRKQENGILPFLLRLMLWLLSFPYRTWMFWRNVAYDLNWLPRYTPPSNLVISVGNLVVGGTGKTPVTLMLAEAFYSDTKLAILSRGYRSPAEKLSKPLVLSQGQGPIHPASFAGDEPYLLADNLPKAIVVVGKNRRAASCLAAQLGARLLILDDALQHRRLERDKDVVVIDLQDPWGLGFFLPRGLLREGKSSLKRADLIVLNHAYDHKAFEKLKQQIASFSQAPVIGTCMEVAGVFDLAGNLVHLKGQKVVLFCGIAHPDYFVKTVRSLGVEIVDEYIFGDHQEPSLEKLKVLSQKCDLLICTEKDKVKVSLDLPIVWVKMRLKIVENKADYQAFIASGRASLKEG